MLVRAMEAGVASFIEKHAGKVDVNGYRLPAVSVYLVGPSVGAHELAAAAVAPL